MLILLNWSVTGYVLVLENIKRIFHTPGPPFNQGVFLGDIGIGDIGIPR